LHLVGLCCVAAALALPLWPELFRTAKHEQA
jgi:hypothetical protein